ncbi:hypothetical protein EAS64_10520 [Trebonia kvetii]|uniref:CHAT domain-containing protein n=1 Tax=Trebonia kvetii TaxID=2480626 RepID=A0A6P2C3J5_9ACTN|nr:hypothetical protein [Trebonia kvetii]TVZ05046.1 hypothetical protein EAS64_10520 [Trebonia kvetii]
MADNTGIRLLGFKGFKASERFLCALEDEIWVARYDPETEQTDIPVHRPEKILSGATMLAELAQPSRVTVVSAHAGYLFNGRRLGFSGDGDQAPVLTVDNLGSFTLGATSMLLIDACCSPALAAALAPHARHGSLIVSLAHEPDEDPFTYGKDSITAIGSVIRELCHAATPDLSPEAAARAVRLTNIQICARNDAERKRGVGNKKAMRPRLHMREC